MAFTEQELAYLRSQPLARVATVSSDGQPDVVPVGFQFDGTHSWIGGFNPTHTRRTRNIQAGNDKVALVIDDLAPGQRWSPRCIRVYGTVELVERPPGSGALVICITPETSWSMNLDADWHAATGGCTPANSLFDQASALPDRNERPMATAFDPYDLRGTALSSRIVMAPMTRSRAYGSGATPTDMSVTYYAQRATAGLIITEGTQPSVVGQGYPDTPGLHSQGQVAAWRKVTEAVHDTGGKIFAQLMHAGRVGDPDLLPGDMLPVGPSTIAPAGQIYTHAGMKPHAVPHALTGAEVEATIADFANAARNAIQAGFDGVEIHGANGYLVHQFLAPNANQRDDEWGGSVAGRTRFAVETARAVASAIGAERTGIRLSPGVTLGDIHEDDLEETYGSLIEQLAALDLAYVHVMEAADQRDLTLRLRKDWPGTFILNPFTGREPTGPDALALIEDGTADLLSFGALFLANPDLPARLQAGGPFNEPDRATSFGGDHRGYIDYPTLTER